MPGFLPLPEEGVNAGNRNKTTAQNLEERFDRSEDVGEGDYLTVTACVWQFPLIALGMAALLICAVSPRLFLRRVAIPGAAFIASIAYSAYLIQKLVIRFVEQFCASHNIALTSAPALICVELCVYAAATILFCTVERPFLQLRKRLAPRSRACSPQIQTTG